MLYLPLSMLHIVLSKHDAAQIVDPISITTLYSNILKILNVFTQSSHTIVSNRRVNAFVPGLRL